MLALGKGRQRTKWRRVANQKTVDAPSSANAISHRSNWLPWMVHLNLRKAVRAVRGIFTQRPEDSAEVSGELIHLNDDEHS